MEQQPTTPQPPTASRKPARLGRDAVVASICAMGVVLMVGAAYAAVPLYTWFCRTTGFAGTPQVAQQAPAHALGRTIAATNTPQAAAVSMWRRSLLVSLRGTFISGGPERSDPSPG